ncbi:hypothetical protein AB0C06_03100 [Micromonospora inaquosa]|uniref:hypothetical protein n=1 Tax=Micromonospora inaquosa TaxID=2203716 RepID=UPI0033F417F4
MDNVSDKVDRAVAGAQAGDKVARAVAAAQEAERYRADPPARADRAWLVEDAAKRYGLSDAQAALIRDDGPTAIRRAARDLAMSQEIMLAAEAEAERNAAG